jgi:hypothetical protein
VRARIGEDEPMIEAARALAALRAFAESCGDVFVAYEAQDSGCVSFGVEADDRRWFLKGPASDSAVGSVTSVIEFHRRVRHAVIVRPVEVVDVQGVPVLRYPWVDGETLYHATTERSGPQVRIGGDAAHHRFRQLPVDQVVFAIDAVFSAHVEVAREGYVAIDLYDGCLHYDFDRRRMRLIDLDEYRLGPVTVPGRRGSAHPSRRRPGRCSTNGRRSTRSAGWPRCCSTRATTRDGGGRPPSWLRSRREPRDPSPSTATRRCRSWRAPGALRPRSPTERLRSHRPAPVRRV